MSSSLNFDFSAAASVPLLTRERLHPAAVNALDESAETAENWLLAFSGGADSLALLLIVWALWPEQRGRLCAAHFNHQLRGEESLADQRFCAAVCHSLGVEFTSAEWASTATQASEEQARTARFAFLAETADQQGSRLLLTGHQQNDIAETHLMRLARGSSSAGLAAPRPVRCWEKGRSIVRPLLTLSATDIRAALSTRSIPWREDASNQTGTYFRNRVRASVVPLWLQASGDHALQGAALTREWLEEDDLALELWLDELGIEKVVTKLNLAVLRSKPRALLRRALRRWAFSAPLARSGFERLINLCQCEEGKMSIGAGFAVVERGSLIWMQIPHEEGENWSGVSVVEGGSAYLPDGSCISLKAVTVNRDLRTRFTERKVDASAEAFVRSNDTSFSIRGWRPGDRYQPLGSTGAAKLQDMFVNRKIEPRRRRRIPLICGSDGRIIWVPGFPPAELSKITPDCVQGLQLTYISGTSTVEQQSLFL